MNLNLTHILVAYDIICMGELDENSAFIDLDKSEIFYFYSGEPDEDILDNYESIEDFLENPKVIQIPNYQELNISRRASQDIINKALQKWCAEENIKLKV